MITQRVDMKGNGEAEALEVSRRVQLFRTGLHLTLKDSGICCMCALRKKAEPLPLGYAASAWGQIGRSVRERWCLSHCSVTVKRHHDPGSIYLGACLEFQRVSPWFS